MGEWQGDKGGDRGDGMTLPAVLMSEPAVRSLTTALGGRAAPAFATPPQAFRDILGAVPRDGGELMGSSGGVLLCPDDTDEPLWTENPPGGPALVVPFSLALAGRPEALMKVIAGAREAAGPGRVLHMPALAAPSNVALLCYLGCDTFDTFRPEAEAALGYMLDTTGRTLVRDDYDRQDKDEGSMGRPTRRPDSPADAARRSLGGLRRAGAVCHCRACSGAPVADMAQEALTAHNVLALVDEVERARRAAAQGLGHLRTLVESRASGDPWCDRALRTADHTFQDYLEARTPVGGEGVYPCVGTTAVDRPAVRRFRRRVQDPSRYVPPERDVLLLLPCSARKPYSDSPSHKRFREVLGGLDPGRRGRVHEVIVTSPLGVVPRELETFFPAAHYDMPVTGRYDGREREMVRDSLASLLDRGAYSQVICHLSAELPFVRDVLEGTGLPVTFSASGSDTGDGAEEDSDGGGCGVTSRTEEADGPAAASPSSQQALSGLAAALSGIGPGDGSGGAPSSASILDASAKLRFQFGPAGAELVAGGDVRSTGPRYRRTLSSGAGQLCVLDSTRGMASLSLTGGEELYGKWRDLEERSPGTPGYWVRIGDFSPKGNLFCVGVEDACPHIRPGDEVVLVHNDEVRGVGRAALCGADMGDLEKGLAVDVRHRKHA